MQRPWGRSLACAVISEKVSEAGQSEVVGVGWGGEDQGRTGGQAVRAWGPLRDTCSSLSVTTGESVQRRLVLGPGRGQARW